MDSADHSLNQPGLDTADRGYGAIVAGVIALVFLGFVAHAATLAPAAAPKAAH